MQIGNFPPILIGFVALSYLLGAIPFGVIISKVFYNIDIREHGSRNPGATNVFRVLGKKPGIATLILDILKGALPVLMSLFFIRSASEPKLFLIPFLCGVAAIIGHNWSIFLKGKGGKGVATSAGVFLALLPKHTGLAILAFVIVLFISKRVSISSMASAIVLFISTFILNVPTSLHRLLVLLAAVMIFVKHIPNMKRLARGEEPKVKFL